MCSCPRLIGLALVLIMLSVPVCADTVTSVVTPPGASYLYSWTWTVPAGGGATSLWIAVHPNVLNAQVAGNNPSGPGYVLVYQGIANYAEGYGMKWAGAVFPNTVVPLTATSALGSGNNYNWTSNGTPPTTGLTQSPAPEAGTLLLLAAGLTSLTGWGVRRRRK